MIFPRILGFIMDRVFVCFENDIHSTVQLNTENCFYLWCGVLQIMCLRLYAKFEGVLQENSLKIHFYKRR